MKAITDYRSSFEDYLKENDWGNGADTLYEPIRYILQNGGKRFRPVLTLLSGDSLGKITELHYQFALGIEVFHNFTLLHDDIMDHADLRRGRAAVHKRFGTNAAILSGDLMLIIATQLIHGACQRANSDMDDVLKLFLKVGQEVCEGQDLDMHLDQNSSASMALYEEMVRQKTAVLIGFSLYAGARASGVALDAAVALYDFGVQSGIVFQMWDDYLDVFSADTTGKRNAGDLYNKKETCLILMLKENMNARDSHYFDAIWSGSDLSEEGVNQIKKLLEKYDIQASMKKLVKTKLNQAKENVGSNISEENLLPIFQFTNNFILRDK
ncbi:MAG: polyprenyl synthetase family protein [Bacteroidetes bacterium]|jgi:geranylgeranyl diphosphate synthase type II|nr:polyprenyl synthetase family protein [Bacteroidota bacterium]